MYLYIIAKIEHFHPLLLKSTVKTPGIPVYTLRNCPNVQYLFCIAKDGSSQAGSHSASALAEMLSQ